MPNSAVAASQQSTALPVAPGAYRFGGTVLALWLAFLLFTPTLGLDWIDSWHNEQRVVQVILLVVTAAALGVLVLHPPWRCGLPAVAWQVWAVFALGIAGALRAGFRDAAFAELGLHLLLLLLVLLAAQWSSADPERTLRVFRNAALLLLGTYLAGVVVRYAAAFAIGQPLNLDVLLLGYANPRFPSALHALLLPLLVDLALDGRESRSLRGVAACVLALAWAVNLALGTRAIWYAFFVSYAVLLPWLGRRRIGAALCCTALSAVVGIALYVLLFREVPQWTGIGETFTQRTLDKLVWGSNRELLIRSSFEAIGEAPWLGIGPMQFAAIPGVWAAHPHNWLLQLASEWGLPATALALWPLGRWLRRAGALARAGTDTGSGAAERTLLTCGVVALVYGLVDGNLVMPVSQSAAALVFGALLGVTANRPPVPRSPLRRAWVAPACAAIVAAAAVELGWFCAVTVGPATAEEVPQRISPTRTLWPRFWSDGFLPIAGDPWETQQIAARHAP